MSNPPFGGGRRDARERALHLLYEADQRDIEGDEVVEGQTLPPDEYAQELVRGVRRLRTEIDASISKHSTGWTLDRLAHMDRLVLEVAIYELLEQAAVPTAVVLNEAVDLAHEYGTDDSGKFVNGVLSSISREIRGDG